MKHQFNTHNILYFFLSFHLNTLEHPKHDTVEERGYTGRVSASVLSPRPLLLLRPPGCCSAGPPPAGVLQSDLPLVQHLQDLPRQLPLRRHQRPQLRAVLRHRVHTRVGHQAAAAGKYFLIKNILINQKYFSHKAGGRQISIDQYQ